jgi:hypothetical protein
VATTETTVVSEWDADRFHQRVIELENSGFVARRESYRIVAEMNPETGLISHVHSMELYRPKAGEQKGRAG